MEPSYTWGTMFSILSLLSFSTDSTTGMALEQISFGPELTVMASEHNNLRTRIQPSKFSGIFG